MRDSCAHCCFKIKGLSVSLDGRCILEGVNLHINCGELIAIVGPNGAGKTTLLKAILREIPSRGSVVFRARGKESDSRPRIGYIPQKLNFEADSPVSVMDLVASALSSEPVWLGLGQGLKKQVSEALSKVQAAHLLKRRIGALSGGELQRVLLAMALTPLPDIFLLDEPVTGIDTAGASLFYQTVDNLRREYDCSVIMVTHDIAGIAPHADRVIVLNKSVIREGTPKEIISDEVLARGLGPICGGGHG
jgi:zinc transport system ATP-binding protein